MYDNDMYDLHVGVSFILLISSSVRQKLGSQLAVECAAQADIVAGVPDSSIAAAIGYSLVSHHITSYITLNVASFVHLVCSSILCCLLCVMNVVDVMF